MKSSTVILLIILTALTISPTVLLGQNFSDTIERTLRFNQPNNPLNRLSVYNIQGNVTVEGYDGTEIKITAHREIEGSEQEIEQALGELEFVAERDGNTAYIYIDAPFITFQKNGGDHFNYNIDTRENDYEFLHNITIQVPKDVYVSASTINKGTVSVRNTTRKVTASNVNGKVELQNIAGATEAQTVNGDITIDYAQSPRENSEYKTVNGTIEVNYPKDLSADIRFKSMHGELYTDFKNIKRLNTTVETNKKQSNGSVKYKVDRFAPIRIGDGGPVFNFEVLNGNVYIKQIQS